MSTKKDLWESQTIFSGMTSVSIQKVAKNSLVFRKVVDEPAPETIPAGRLGVEWYSVGVVDARNELKMR